MNSWAIVVLVVASWFVFALVVGPILGQAIGAASNETPDDPADAAVEPAREPAPAGPASAVTVAPSRSGRSLEALTDDEALLEPTPPDAPLQPLA